MIYLGIGSNLQSLLQNNKTHTSKQLLNKQQIISKQKIIIQKYKLKIDKLIQLNNQFKNNK